MDLEEVATVNGFESSYEMMMLIAQVNLSTPEKLQEFNAWKMLDGTKDGLLELLRNQT